MCKNKIKAIASGGLFFVLLTAFFVVSTANNASAAGSNKKIGEFSDWGLFTTVDKDNTKVCYIASLPKSSDGNYRRRGEAFLTVTLIDGDKNAEVSTSSGYFYKKGTEVNINIGSKGFTMYPYEERAWLISDSEDVDMIAAMKDGVRTTVKGISSLGTYSQDTYSLIGFTEAYDKMTEVCHKK